MNARPYVIVCAVAIALFTVQDAYSFDTRSRSGPKGEAWQAIYLGQNFVPRANGLIAPMTNGGRNEHSDLTELSLHEIGADIVIGKVSRKTLTVVDLNASLFRPFLRALGKMPGDNANTSNPLEQRLLPPVPQWAGVPDFGFSIDDWINKHHYCPPRNGDGFAKCHVYFGGWLAAYNSSHFGSQSAGSYALLHKTALNLAKNAATLRSLVDASDGSTDFPGDRAAHRDKIEEAEMMAYYYEAAAQHFLEDRWSTGHMWERWNGPDMDQSPYGNDVVLSSEVGAAAGLLHGSEAFSGLPDAVSSPYFSAGSSFLAIELSGGDVTPGGLPPIKLSTFRLGKQGKIFPGMGDERLQDFFDGGFGAEYTIRGGVDVGVNVSGQRKMMMACLNASWAQTIRAVGKDQQSGGYGVLGIKLKAPFNTGYKPDHTCTDMWLTNEAVALGWIGDSIAPFAVMGRTAVNMVLKLGGAIRPEAQKAITALGLRTDWLETTAHVTMRYWRAPKGTDLASGGLSSFGLAKHGGAYNPPSYLSKTDLSTLPERDGRRGIDKQAVFGFFNRANADYFCKGLADRLKEMRGTDDRTQRAVCHYLADRAWAGTDPAYNGIQTEQRQAPNGQRAHAICQLFRGDARIATGKYDEHTPEYLHPGYTPIRNKSDKTPYGQDPYKVTSASVGNWCDKIPVLNLVDDQAKRDEDVVAVQNDPEDEIVVSGLQLGSERGELTLATVQGTAIEGIEITRWSGDEIRFTLPKDTNPGESDLLISLVRADKVKSVGRFVVRRDPPRPKIAQVVLKQDGSEIYRDDGDPDKPGIFRLIDSGEVDITITFEDSMSKVAIKAKRETIKLRGLAAAGEWKDDTTWHGRVMIPAGSVYANYRGVTALSIMAASAKGVWIDTDPQKAGLQPDETRRVVIDRFPLYAQEVRVSSDAGVFYHATWAGDDPAKRGSILSSELRDTSRKFTMNTAKPIPATGTGTIRITLSHVVDAAPQLTIGGTAVALKGRDDIWSGTFDLPSILPQQRDELVPVVITIADEFGRGGDSDPRTLTSIRLPPKGGRFDSWWRHYEEKPGKESTGKGGDDHWHKLGPPPTASLVILLDGSGSMGDNSNMVNAKKGLIAALGQLQPGIEIGAVTFHGCGSITNFPFTKNKEQVKANLLGIEPSGGTPIGAAIAAARVMLETDAHPMSRQWSFLPFTDGEETCGGDPGAELSRLNASIHAHDLGATPADNAEETPTNDPVAKLPDIPCNPMTRTAYSTDIRDGGLHLDTITLIETTYQEIKGANGRCALLLTTHRYGVYYGATNGKTLWRVNSKPSKTSRQSAGSNDGADEVAAFRKRAMTVLAGLNTMQTARGNVERAVNRSVTR